MEAKLQALVTEKKTGKFISYQVMKLNYKIEDNTLWITDHRGYIVDFDLNEYDVEIKTIK